MKFFPKWFNRYDALYIILAAVLVILYVRVANGGFPLDDSWIHQVYGRNLAETGRWEFVRGVPSAGSTSPLYTLLLATGYLLGIPFMVWTHFLGVIALAAAGMIGSRLAASMGEKFIPNAKRLPLAAGLALVSAWHLVWAAVSGMETMIICTFMLALMWTAWEEAASDSAEASLKRGALFGVLTAFATATRPEAVGLAGIIGIVMLLVQFPQWRRFILWSIGAAVGFVVCIAPYFLLNYQLTGGLLPNTAAAKQAAMVPALTVYSFPDRLWTMFYPLIAGGQLILAFGMVAVMGVAVLRIREQRVWMFYLVPVLWTTALIALYAARLPAGGQHGRYVMTVLPGMIVIGVIGTFWLVRRGRVSIFGRVFSRTLAMTSVLVFIYFAVLVGPVTYRADVGVIDQEQVAAAMWIRDNLPADELLALHDIGAVGYFAPRSIIDVAGLVSPEIIPIILNPDAVWELLRQNDVRYLMAFPDQIPGDDVNDPHLCPIYRSTGETSPAIGGPSMVVYALTWNNVCP